MFSMIFQSRAIFWVFLLFVSCHGLRAEPLLPAEQIRSDFQALYDGLKSAHYDLFANRSREAYDARFLESLAQIDEPMSRHEVSKFFQRFAAFGNVAHARIDYDSARFTDYRENDGGVFPVYLRIKDGRSFVADNRSGNQRLVAGMEILTLNGQPMSLWLERTARHISADTDYIAHSLLEYWFSMYLWEELGAVASFDLEVKHTDGEVSSLSIPALSREAMQANADKNEQWFELDGVSREAEMLDDDIAYLRPGPFYNVEQPDRIWDNRAFVEFVDAAFSDFLEADAKHLIVDLRGNPGGDNSFSDPMVAWFATEPFKFASSFRVRSSQQARASNQARLDANPGQTEGASVFFAEQYEATPIGEVFEYPIPETEPRTGRRFNGNVYVLINRQSYSNAVTVAALVQDYGFGQILGEKTSDMATTYGAMETFALPATGLIVGFPKAHIVRPSGELKTDGVTPDVAITTPVTATRSDVVLEAAIRHVLAEE